MEDSINIIETIFKGITFNQFVNEYWSKQILFQFQKTENVFLDFTIKDFENILNKQRFSSSEINVFDRGKEIMPLEIMELDNSILPLKLFQLCSEGKTLRIKNIHLYSNKISSFIDKLGLFFENCEIRANIYYSRGPSKGLQPHYDSHHIIAYQVFGSKQWDLGGKIIENSTQDFNPIPITPPVLQTSILLKEGEFFYMPPGYWHSVSTPEVSLHITFGIHLPRLKNFFLDFANYIVNKHEIFREELKPFYNKSKFQLSYPNTNDLLVLTNLYELEISNFLIHQAKKTIPFNNLYYELPVKPKIFNESEIVHKVDSDLEELSEAIWKLSSHPLSVYLRGSFKNSNSEFIPWDLDIYFVVDDKKYIPNNAKDISSLLNENYPHFPTIDLTIIDKPSLIFDDNHFLKKCLLLSDAVLLKGTELKKEIDFPVINEIFVQKIKRIQSNIVAKKIQEAVLTVNDDTDETETINLEKSLTKALFRAGMYIMALNEKRFSRNLVECVNAINSAFPNLFNDTNFLMKSIRGELIEFEEFINTVYRIKKIVFDE